MMLVGLLRCLQPAGTPRVPAGLLLLLLIWLSLSVQAQTRKGMPTADAILGVKIGMNYDEARAKLDGLGTSDGQDTRAGGRKEVWTLQGTEYQYLVVKTNAKKRVIQVSGFFRPGKGLSFDRLGDLSRAVGTTGSQAIWNVETPGGGYRLVAKGQNGVASVVYILDLSMPAIQ